MPGLPSVWTRSAQGGAGAARPRSVSETGTRAPCARMHDEVKLAHIEHASGHHVAESARQLSPATPGAEPDAGEDRIRTSPVRLRHRGGTGHDAQGCRNLRDRTRVSGE